jgi:hypothetical protein
MDPVQSIQFKDPKVPIKPEDLSHMFRTCFIDASYLIRYEASMKHL